MRHDTPLLTVAIQGFRLKLRRDAGEFEVWIDTEVSDYDGFIIGLGATKDAALTDAVKTIEQIHDALQGGAFRG